MGKSPVRLANSAWQELNAGVERPPGVLRVFTELAVEFHSSRGEQDTRIEAFAFFLA